MQAIKVTATFLTLLSGCALLKPGYARDSSDSRPTRLVDRLDEVATMECPKLREMFDAARHDYWTNDNVYEGNVDVEKYSTVVASLARCGESKLIFEDVASVNGTGAPEFGLDVLLSANRQSEGAVFALFQQYAKSNVGSAFLPTNAAAARHIGKWMLRAEHNQCDLIGTATEGSDEHTLRGFRDFFIEAECKQGIALLVEQLSDSNPDVRTVTCARLGQVGDRSVLDKVDFLARNDRTFQFGERPSDGRLERDAAGRPLRKYVVAYTCQLAAEMIRHRTKK